MLFRSANPAPNSPPSSPPMPMHQEKVTVSTPEYSSQVIRTNSKHEQHSSKEKSSSNQPLPFEEDTLSPLPEVTDDEEDNMSVSTSPSSHRHHESGSRHRRRRSDRESTTRRSSSPTLSVASSSSHRTHRSAQQPSIMGALFGKKAPPQHKPKRRSSNSEYD